MVFLKLIAKVNVVVLRISEARRAALEEEKRIAAASKRRVRKRRPTTEPTDYPLPSSAVCSTCGQAIPPGAAVVNKSAKTTLWWVDGISYETAGAAALVHKVYAKTIRRWCKGYVLRGKHVPPKDNCWTE